MPDCEPHPRHGGLRLHSKPMRFFCIFFRAGGGGRGRAGSLLKGAGSRGMGGGSNSRISVEIYYPQAWLIHDERPLPWSAFIPPYIYAPSPDSPHPVSCENLPCWNTLMHFNQRLHYLHYSTVFEHLFWRAGGWVGGGGGARGSDLHYFFFKNLQRGTMITTLLNPATNTRLP